MTAAQTLIWETSGRPDVTGAKGKLLKDHPAVCAITGAHVTALGAALHLWAGDGTARLGAKTAQGYGMATIHHRGMDDWAGHYAAWAEHTTSHADDIKALLEELVK